MEGMSVTILSPEERAKRNFFLINFIGELRLSLQNEMEKRDEESKRCGTQLETLFSPISSPDPDSPFSFLIVCGGKAKCAVNVSETTAQSGHELLLNFEGGNSERTAYPMAYDGQAFKAFADAAEVTTQQVAKVVIERLIQERLHCVNEFSPIR
jgi:hypothetical protein